ncbi:MAG: putative maltokinase [Alphaproteobacteria bacterium]|nr:putative maltokinase [Alphaproteobacteria bacterium]
MRINLGIRRRLAPLMENDRRKLELLNSVMFSMPGTPVMYYGDEIGMGDNVFLGDRDGVRTPMQWTPDRNGGFSRCDPARLYLPPIMDPVYGFQSVNVEAQSRSPSSLLNWVKRLIAVRVAHRAFGRGDLKFLYPKNRKVLAYLRRYEDEAILCVVNLARSPQAVELDLSEFKGRTPIELLGRSAFPRIGELTYLLTLQGFGFFWFVLAPAEEPEDAGRGPASIMPEFVTLVLPRGWADLLDRHNRPQFEADVLPAYIAAQRWFAGKDQALRAVSVEAVAELPGVGDGWLLAFLETRLGNAVRQNYFLPLALLWEGDGDTGPSPQKLAEARRFRRNGAVLDAGADPGFVRAVLQAMQRGAVIESEGGRIRFRRTAAFERVAWPEEPSITRIGGEQSNTSALLGEHGVLKIYRRLQPGVNPEVEMASFLTEVAGFQNTPALLGTFERIAPSGEATALGVLVAYMRNQGEAWTQSLDYLSRYLEEATLGAGEAVAASPSPSSVFFFNLARQLGLRTAQMHRALCPDPAGAVPPDFAPEPITAADIAAWRAAVLERGRRVVEALRHLEPGHPAAASELVQRMAASGERLAEAIDRLLPPAIGALKTRFHGDYHLGQVLVVQNDFTIIDFEGEPLRPLAERRAKSSPLRDVAGMLRSFDYVAATGLRQLAEIQPSLRPVAESSAARWRTQACDAFMAGYLEEMAGCKSLPADPRLTQRLILFFALEKALYEIEYELANRPGWLAIPLSGVFDLLDIALASSEGGDAG